MEDKVVHVKKGEILIKKGERSHDLYWVLEGSFEVYTKARDLKVSIATLKNGDLVGEISFIDQKPRSANVVALEDSKVMRLEYEEFKEMVEQTPKWLKKIMLTLTSKLREFTQVGRE